MASVKSVIATCAVAMPVLALVAQGRPSPAAAAAPTRQPPAFAQCRMCHSVERDGKSGIGPNLFGVAGSVAGSKPGFTYSPAMVASRWRWDRTKLDRFMADPKAALPATKMMAPGVKDAAKRKEIIDYLSTLK